MHWIQNMAFLVWHSPNYPFLPMWCTGFLFNSPNYPFLPMWCTGFLFNSPNNPFLYRTESGRSLNPSVRMRNPCQGCQHGGHPAAWWGVPTTAFPLLARGEERPCWEEGGQNSTVTSASSCVSTSGPWSTVFQHRASGGNVSCRKVPPCYWCLHTRHTTRNMCPLFIQQILIHFPKSTIHDSFLLLAPTTPGLNIRLKPIEPFAPSWI